MLSDFTENPSTKFILNPSSASARKKPSPTTHPPDTESIIFRNIFNKETQTAKVVFYF